MVQLSSDQSACGPGFDAAVGGDGGYVWWYIDALSDDGQHGLTLIAFIGSVFSPYYAWSGWQDPFQHCAINVALYRLNRSGGRWAMTERRADVLERSTSHFTLGPSSLSWTDGCLNIAIREICTPVPFPLTGSIRLIPEIETEASFDLDPLGRHRWRPLAPRARVELAFTQPDLSWSGAGYFDTNSGTEPLERAFAHWHWGRAHRGEDLRLFYDVFNRDGPRLATYLRVDRTGKVDKVEPVAGHQLSGTFWGIDRYAWADQATTPRVIKTLEDTPFYARSALTSALDGEPVIMMHETLNLDRLKSPFVRPLLPFRMPRRFF